MNTIVNKLLDVDKQARQMLDEAQQYYECTLREIEEEKQKLREHYTGKARHHVEDLEAQQAEDIQDAVTNVREHAAELLRVMEEHYAQYHVQWETELYERVLASEPLSHTR